MFSLIITLNACKGKTVILEASILTPIRNNSSRIHMELPGLYSFSGWGWGSPVETGLLRVLGGVASFGRVRWQFHSCRGCQVVDVGCLEVGAWAGQ